MTGDSPLEALHAIRDFELEMARRVETAHSGVEELLREARARERTAVTAAEERGRAEAARRLAATVARAEADANEIRADGVRRVAALEESVPGRIDSVVEQLVEFVLAPPLEEGT